MEPWLRPPELLRPGAGEIHVWRVGLTPEPGLARTLEATLSPDERVRAGRYRFPEDRRRFVVARGALRSILGRCLCSAPEDIRFTYSRLGKPLLEQTVAGAAIGLNVSHSQELALLAVAAGRAVGIDVERVRADPEVVGLGERYFSRREVARLQALPEPARTEGFYNCWTRKEAYLKARGDGLSFPLDRFAVSLAPGEPAALLWVDGEPLEAGRWSLRHLSPAPGYVGALAVEGHGWRLCCWEWP